MSLKKNTLQRDGRYEKMLLLILVNPVWLITASSFIFQKRTVTFMARGKAIQEFEGMAGAQWWSLWLRPGQCWSWLYLGTLGVGEVLWSQWWFRFLPGHTQKASHTYTWWHVCVCVCPLELASQWEPAWVFNHRVRIFWGSEDILAGLHYVARLFEG